MTWKTRPLIEIADLTLGKMLDQQKNKGDLVPYLANINVRWGTFDLNNLRLMRFERNEIERYGLKYGDIVMCEGGEPGRCAIWKNSLSPMLIQKALHRIRVKDEIDYRYLYYELLQKGRTNAFSPLFTGTTIKHLPRQNLAKLEVRVPPMPVQQRIASILSAYDDLIENNRRRIQLLEESARLLYKEWFVHLRFPGHEHTKVVDGVPEGWERKLLGEVVTVRKGRNITKATAVPGMVPVVAGGLGPAYYHNEANVTAPVITVSASGANAGYVNIYLEDIWASDCSYISAEDTTVFHFLFQTLKWRQPEIFAMQKGAAQPHVYPKDLAKLPIIVPDRTLLDMFEGLAARCFDQMFILQRQDQASEAARDLLLPRLLNGDYPP